jgi:hypothetical protein
MRNIFELVSKLENRELHPDKSGKGVDIRRVCFLRVVRTSQVQARVPCALSATDEPENAQDGWSDPTHWIYNRILECRVIYE